MVGNIVSLASRRSVVPGAMLELEKQDAISRLRGHITRDFIVYAVLRFYSSENDWIVCDLYLIDGHHVMSVTDDIGRALDRHDPSREVGLKLARPRGRDPLRELIDGALSRLLFGVPDQVRHQVIR